MEDLMKRLNEIARLKSTAFCYGCYRDAPSGQCATCGSDDLARLLPETGVDWGLEWVSRHLIEAHLEAADLDAAFEDFVSECYPETVQVAWLNVDTVTAAKRLDPVSWELAKSEWCDSEVTDERLVTFDHGGSYFLADDVLRYVEEQEAELEIAS